MDQSLYPLSVCLSVCQAGTVLLNHTVETARVSEPLASLSSATVLLNRHNYGLNGALAPLSLFSLPPSVCVSLSVSVSGWDGPSQSYDRNGSFSLSLSLSVCLSACLSVCLSLVLSQAFLWRRLRKGNGLNPTKEQATPRRSHTRLCALPASNTASFRPVDSCPLPLTITEWNILSEAIASSHFLLSSESKLNRFL